MRVSPPPANVAVSRRLREQRRALLLRSFSTPLRTGPRSSWSTAITSTTTLPGRPHPRCGVQDLAPCAGGRAQRARGGARRRMVGRRAQRAVPRRQRLVRPRSRTPGSRLNGPELAETGFCEPRRYWGGKPDRRAPHRRCCDQPRRNAIDGARLCSPTPGFPPRLRYSSPRFDAWRMRFDDGLRKASGNGSLTSSGQVRALVTGNGHGVRATLEYRLVERAVLPCFGHR